MGGWLRVRGGVEKWKIVVFVLRSARQGVGHQDEPRLAPALTSSVVGGATLGVDRHYPHLIGGIGKPAIAAEGVQIVHTV